MRGEDRARSRTWLPRPAGRKWSWPGAARRRAAAEAGQHPPRQDRELIALISGDLHTHLTALIGHLELLADPRSGPLTGEQQRLLTVMRRSCGRLRAIADDLLFIARAGEARAELAWEELSLQQLAAAAVAAQQPAAASAGISLRLDAQRCPLVAGDRLRLDDLIDRLLASVLAATPPGGSVTVALHPADGQVRLQVCGTGPGMTGMPGGGLDLAIVEAIASAHHASVSVDSRPGEGATFRVGFPAASGGHSG